MKKKLKSFHWVSTDGDTGKKTYRNFKAYNTKDALRRVHKRLMAQAKRNPNIKIKLASERAKKYIRKESRPRPRERASITDYL